MADSLHNALTNNSTDGSLHNLHLPGYNVANATAMGNITTGSAGDLCFVQSSGSYYAYSGTTWQPMSGVLIDSFTATDDSVITASSGTDWTLLSTTPTLRGGTYFAICKLFVNTVGQGGIGMKMDGVTFGSSADARNAGEYTLFGITTVTSGSHTLIINYNREAASGVFGLSSDPRWGRAVTIIGPIK